MTRLRLAIAASFLATLASLVLLAGVDVPNVLLKLSSLCVVGAWAGFVLGAIFGRECVRAIGWSAFVAAAVACLPVVLVTYGFALAGAPLVAAFAIVVAAGARCGAATMEYFGVHRSHDGRTPPL
ncbi:hypothetical protein ACPWT1_18775 [Ramlibacter sp. MMS24-I3-19]|uniref:hypothetical protein n=1 Tax=Ramlibacter sp. MMS24-I3-19 TaxID=3416606 RepID=UPI003D02A58E